MLYRLGLTSFLAVKAAECNESRIQFTSDSVTVMLSEYPNASFPLFTLADQVDQSLNPGQSFYHYVNNLWLNKTTIPDDKSGWGAVNVLSQAASESIQMIIEESPKDSIISRLYALGMDTKRIESEKLAPIKDLLDLINGIKSLREVWKVLATLQRQSMSPAFILFGSIPDEKNSDMVTAYMSFGNTVIDKETWNSSTKDEILPKYQSYIEKIFSISGLASNSSAIQKLKNNTFNFESKLVDILPSQEDLLDPMKTYNKMTLAELKASAKSIDFSAYFEALGVDVKDSIIMNQPTYFSKLEAVLNSTDIQVIKTYLQFTVLVSSAPYLHREMEEANFNFFYVILSGQTKMSPRHRKIANIVSVKLADPVGEIYVKKYFPPEAKKAANEMVQLILSSFNDSIKQSSWLSQETKDKAIQKLSKITVKIGYPDKWGNYTELAGMISSNVSFLNNLRIIDDYFHQFFTIHALYKPSDKSQWQIAPFVVNAIYNPTSNDITFPAAILQPPFFYAPTASKPYGDPALSFGAIGSVIGHEITHGFDSSGRKYDGDGNLNDWWTKKDTESFEKRSDILVKQYDSYELLGQHVNGKLTLTENIADLGGVTISFGALKKWMETHKDYKAPKSVFNERERFFQSFALSWGRLNREELTKQLLLLDNHSPDQFRVNGVLSNIPEFYELYNVSRRDKMYIEPQSRVNLWSLENQEQRHELYSNSDVSFGMNFYAIIAMLLLASAL